MEMNRSPLGRAIDREGLGREGGGRLFINRRQRDLERGFLGSDRRKQQLPVVSALEIFSSGLSATKCCK